ncbi:hypothetical protein V8E36_002510 [Tilletia maclaganii]
MKMPATETPSDSENEAAEASRMSSPLPSLSQFLNLPATQEHNLPLTQASTAARWRVREHLDPSSQTSTTPERHMRNSGASSPDKLPGSSPPPASQARFGPWQSPSASTERLNSRDVERDCNSPTADVEATAEHRAASSPTKQAFQTSEDTVAGRPEGLPVQAYDGTQAHRTSSMWTLRPELQNTEAQYYLGPLQPVTVLELLLCTPVNTHARTALTGTPGGYLKYFHFLGPATLPSSRRRPAKRRKIGSTASTSGDTIPASRESSSLGRDGAADGTVDVTLSGAGVDSAQVGSAESAVTGVVDAARTAATPTTQEASAGQVGDTTGATALLLAASLTRDQWQCRVCHLHLHVPTGSVANLGAHLYGPKGKSVGCLDLRGSTPSEPIPMPERDARGSFVRVGPDRPKSASRMSRKCS